MTQMLCQERDWDVGNFKKEARRYATAFTGPKASVLMMPAAKLRCVEQAIRVGLVDPGTTKFLLVERDSSRFDQMVAKAKKIGLIHVDADQPQELDQVVPVVPLDYCFLDFNGPLTQASSAWIHDTLRPNLADNADLAITLLYSFRNNQFMHRVSKAMREDPTLRRYHFLLGCKYQIGDPIATDFICLLNLLLWGYDFEMHTVIKYRDTRPMLMFRFTEIHKASINESDRPIYEKLVRYLRWFRTPRARVEITATPKSGAIKVGATRRRRKADLEKMFSHRAKKAWATRRSNARRPSARPLQGFDNRMQTEPR